TPYWASASLTNGTGPGTEACLAELVAIANGQCVTIWSLRVSSDGSSLWLAADGENGPIELLRTDIAWSASAHCLALDYGTNGTALFIDGQLVAQGAATPAVPSDILELAVGSSVAGTEPAEGAFDEVCSLAASRRQTVALT